MKSDEQKNAYIAHLESIIYNLWYMTPLSDKYKLPVTVRSIAKEIHERKVGQRTEEIDRIPFIGKYGDGE